MRDTDGRLDLDDLGDVIEHATTIGGAAPPPVQSELLDDGRGRTWGDRLEDAGITPWLRRHRVPLALVTVTAVVVGGGSLAYVRTRPPAYDPVIAATATPAPSGQTGDIGIQSDWSGLMTAAYTIRPERPGDVVELIGVVGPGIRASRARQQKPDDGDTGRTADLNVRIGCDDDASLRSTPGDYRLQVRRTDSYGRSDIGYLPYPQDQFSWDQQVMQYCIPTRISSDLTVPPATFTADVATRRLSFDVIFRNAMSLPLSVTPSTYDNGTAVRFDATDAVIPAHSTTIVRATATLQDCLAPRLGPSDGAGGVFFDGDGNQVDPPQLISFGASLAEPPLGDPISSYYGFGGTQVYAGLAPATLRALASTFDDMCAGMPQVAVSEIGARALPGTPPTGDPEALVVRARLRVTTQGTRVEAVDATAPADIAAGMLPRITSDSAPVRAGHADLTLDWTTGCNGDLTPPIATIQVRARDGRTYPVRVVLRQEDIAVALISRCPALDRSTLNSYGWEDPGMILLK